MRPLAPLLFLVLAGCASAEVMKKSEEYGIAFELIQTDYGEFRVYEHPTKKSLAVSSTLGAAFGQGIAKGLTFGAGNILPSEGAYRQAAEAYLAKHRALASCKITDGYLLQEPIFEFIFECSNQ